MFADLPELPQEQRWRQQSSPAPIVVALIRRPDKDGKVTLLLIRRNGDAYGGQWALVGGKWDFGETMATAIVREVKEETDLDTEFVGLRGIVNERVISPEPDGTAAHFLLFVCELAASDGRAQEQAEGEVAWFGSSDIELLHQQGQIIPSDYLMIRTFSEQKGAAFLYEAEMVSTIAAEAGSVPMLIRFEAV